jgi:mono/diheme cytochrome c family protein
MNNRMFVLAFLAVSLGAPVASAQNQTKQDVSAALDSHDYSELNKAPAKARTRINPFQNDPDAIVAGQIHFEDHCAECHGAAGIGGKKGPSLRHPEVQNATAGTLFWLLTNGVAWKGMPVWSKLPEAQRWQLVRYLKTLGVNDGYKTDGKP